MKDITNTKSHGIKNLNSPLKTVKSAKGVLKPFKGLFFLITFGISAIILPLSIKTIAGNFKWQYIGMLNLAQIVFSLAILHICMLLNILKIDTTFTKEKFIKFLPLSIVFFTVAFTGNISFYFQTLTTNSTIKRLSIIPGITLQWMVIGIKPTFMDTVSGAVIISGVIITGFYEDHKDIWGILLTLIYVVAYAVYNVLIHKYVKDVFVFETLYFMYILSIPTYLLVIIFEFYFMGKGVILSFYYNGAILSFLGSTIVAIFYNVSIFFGNKYNTPLSVILVSSLKNILVVVFDLLFDVRARFGKTVPYYLGVATTFIGWLIYGVAKLLKKKRKAKKEVE